ncbi:hypothetical protein BDP55DRAFT_32407 [Colletotrichum godetiae]|uniref:Uncharacterized protein n=1 Tax=Colletotrichum godetiae TaxID=1209918 RepID=A0AAJ0EVK3_9PEZI|nr:uncharacterized protein BDP55DRAFT_32407 [Colletotrichum godetiae]KAK1688854.1 hypothetical protein BDP55DRAFT_32407 [Colletotrichum godetiae]
MLAKVEWTKSACFARYNHTRKGGDSLECVILWFHGPDVVVLSFRDYKMVTGLCRMRAILAVASCISVRPAWSHVPFYIPTVCGE